MTFVMLSSVVLVLTKKFMDCIVPGESPKYQGVKNFTLVARMQNSSSILRPTDDESSMF